VLMPRRRRSRASISLNSRPKHCGCFDIFRHSEAGNQVDFAAEIAPSN
jgi:hypothetical protein